MYSQFNLNTTVLYQWCSIFWPHGPGEWCRASLQTGLGPMSVLHVRIFFWGPTPLLHARIRLWAPCCLCLLGLTPCAGVGLWDPVLPLPSCTHWDQALYRPTIQLVGFPMGLKI